MNNFINLGERFGNYLKYKGLGNNKTAEILGFSGSQVSNIVNGKVFGTDKIFKILNVFQDIDANWLFRNEGEMLKNTSSIHIKGDNKGVANTGVIHGGAIVDNKYSGNYKGSTIVAEGSNYYDITREDNNTRDINNLFDAYNVDKGVEIERLQKLYETMLESKDLVIQELKETIQNLKEQIQELREDKRFLKEALQKNQM